MDRLRRVLVLSVATAIALLPAARPVDVVAQGRAFLVSVTDNKGEPKPGVTAADLNIELNGKPATGATVAPASGPVSIVVLTEGIGRDSISEARKMMKAVVDGARAIHPESRVGLMVKDGAAFPAMHVVTTDAAALDNEISRVFESTRNAPLLDSIVSASQALSFEKNARRAIIAVTSGVNAPTDVMSPVRVANAVRQSGASFWAIDLGGREGVSEAAEPRVLSDVTVSSGGRHDRATVPSIAPLAERIMTTLKGQYAITFDDGLSPKAASPKVSARAKDTKVLAPRWPAIK
jgi:hypothetical protein